MRSQSYGAPVRLDRDFRFAADDGDQELALTSKSMPRADAAASAAENGKGDGK
jgi:hypothetical protein